MTTVLIQDVIAERMAMWEKKLKKADNVNDVIRFSSKMDELYWVLGQLER